MSLLDADKRALLERLRRERGIGGGIDPIPRWAGPGPAQQTLGQQRLWTAEVNRAPDERSAYVRTIVFELKGPLDVEVLRRSLALVVERHESWRTALELAGEVPVQRVLPAGPIDLPVSDLSGVSVAGRAAAVQRQIDAMDRAVDLRRPPLFRLRILRLGDALHTLLIVAHHAIYDARSIQILFEELDVIYRTLESGASLALPAPSNQMSDVAVWERARRAGPGYAAQIDYWAAQLDGAPTVLEVVPDLTRKARSAHRASQQLIEFPTGLAARIRELARACGATPYSVAMAALSIFLSRHAAQRDLLIGMTSLGRKHPSMRSMLGYFVDLLPVRVLVEPQASFRELVGHVGETVKAALEHDDVPFEELVRSARVPYDRSRHPLCQVVMTLEQDAGPLQIGPVEVREREVDDGISPFDLSLAFTEAGDELRGMLTYDAELYTAESAVWMATHLSTVVAAAVSAPDDPLARLSLSALDEQRKVAEAAIGPLVSEDFVPIQERFRARARQMPGAIAVVLDDECHTYGELDAASDAIAARLLDLGVQRGEPVAILIDRSFALIAAVVGTSKAGAAVLGLDPEHPDARVQLLVADAGARIVLTTCALAARVLPTARCVLVDDDSLPAQPTGVPVVDVGPDDACSVHYTSGSSGTPKGVINTHRGMHNRLMHGLATNPMGDNGGFLFKSPMTFDASFWEIWEPLIAGARVVVARPGGHRDPAYLVDLIERGDVTAAFIVTTVLQLMLTAIDRPGRCPRLRWVLFGGEKTSTQLAEEFNAKLEAQLVHVYGPTEAAVTVTGYAVARGPVTALPIGKPIANTQVHILDEDLHPTAIGVVGEVYIGGACVARGYLNRPAMTAERFVPSPFGVGTRMYRTGDYGRQLPSGDIEFIGRSDEQFKIRGVRVELGEVEANVLGEPGVAEATVVVRKNARGDDDLVAYVVPERAQFAGQVGAPPGDEVVFLDDSIADPDVRARLDVLIEAIRVRLRERLPLQIVPADVWPVSALPRTTSGKVDRRRLPVREARARSLIHPTTAAERLVTTHWAAMLMVPTVGMHDSFFSLGGNSLLAAKLASRIGSEFQVEVSVAVVLSGGTPAAMVEALSVLFGGREILEGAAEILLADSR